MKVLRRIGKIAVIVLLTAVVALIIWTIISWWAAIMLFLINLLTAIGLMIMFGVPTMIYVAWLWGRSANYRHEGRSAHVLIILTLAVYAIIATRAHFVERSRMEPLRQKFVATASRSRGDIINGNPYSGGGQLDFGGRLKVLVEERQSRCRQDGFTYLGSWDVSQMSIQSKQEIRTAGVYIWAPWVSL